MAGAWFVCRLLASPIELRVDDSTLGTTRRQIVLCLEHYLRAAVSKFDVDAVFGRYGVISRG